MVENTFWVNNIKSLYENQNYLNFIPTSTMSRYDQLNAVTRMCIYTIILSVVFRANGIWYQVPIIIIILLVILVHLNIVKDNIVLSDISKGDGYIEAGYYNQNNKLTFPSDLKKKSTKHRKCRMPEPNNPFANPTVFDALEDSPPLACNADDENIDSLNKQVTNSFNDQLFRDVSDLYDVKNSQRQFYTVAGGKTPDTIGFANWLYGNMPSCKSNQGDCYKYEDMSQSRPLITRTL